MHARVPDYHPTSPFQTVSEKPSEKGRRSLRCSLTEHRNGTFQPIFASQHVQSRGQSIARTPFRTVSRRGVLRSSQARRSKKFATVLPHNAVRNNALEMVVL